MSLTEDYTFKLGDNGIVLNSDATVPFVDITRVTGLDNAPFRSTERDHEGVDGSFMDAEFEQGRTIILEGTLYTGDEGVETFLDNLKENFQPSTDLVPFYVKPDGQTERILFVKSLGCKYDWASVRRYNAVEVQLTVYAENPMIFGPEVTSTIVLGAQTFPGFGFDFGFDFGFGGTTAVSDGLTINNAGNRPAPLKFIIPGPVTNPSVISDTASATLRFNLDIASGDALYVDTYYRTARLNDTANRRGTLATPDWFYLLKGDNFLRFRADSSTSVTLTIKHRPTWR